MEKNPILNVYLKSKKSKGGEEETRDVAKET